MSKISDKLNIISSAKDDIKTAIENKGVSVGNIGIQEYASKIDKITGSEVYPTLQEKTVVPTNEIQEVTPDDGIYGLSKVTVDKVNLQNKTVTPSSSEQIVKADSEYNGLNEVIVNGDDNLISENIVQGKTIFGVEGTAEIGGGGTPIEKGLIINACDSDGFVTDASIVGMTSIPDYYCYNHSTTNGFFKNLKNIELPSELTKIGQNSFAFCTKLSLDSLPSTLTSIGANGFGTCSSLALTSLPSGLVTLSTNTFRDCTNLALTSLPSGIKELPQYVFYNCKNIDIKEIPSGVTVLNANAFYGCAGLTEITCDGLITQIATYCFYNCSNLTKLVLPNITKVPTLKGTNAFTGTPIANGTGYIYVPDDLVDSFKGATNWSTYANQIKGVSEL